MAARLAIAGSSALAAAAGEAMARAGGNAVDAAIAAILVSINTEPGVCSLGCGGYLTVWQAGGEPPVTLDGYVAVPGLGDPAPRERVAVQVDLAYGGGVRTIVGPDTVGVPGGVAALGEASRRFGRLPWRTLLEPAIEAARAGFPLPVASHHYLEYSAAPIYSRSADGHAALHDEQGRLQQPGARIVVPHLADSLEQLARQGPEDFYTGELGAAICAHVRDQGGRLAAEDMSRYRIISRPSLTVDAGGWQIATNPPPAIGGSVLGAMLTMMSAQPPVAAWDEDSLSHLIAVQHAALGYRRDRLDLSDDISADARRLLDLAAHAPAELLEAGSTCHASAVDDKGLACSITMSAGYGSGEMPPGTGIWLNNCLGELELNRRGLDVGPPGSRLPSNMAPTAGISDRGEVMAIGSPGADRITTAILQVLVNHIHLGLELTRAVEHPRVHVEFPDGFPYRAAYEEPLPVSRLAVPQRAFAGLSMFFGGVSAATWCPGSGFAAAADPRRTGGTWRPEP